MSYIFRSLTSASLTVKILLLLLTLRSQGFQNGFLIGRIDFSRVAEHAGADFKPFLKLVLPLAAAEEE